MTREFILETLLPYKEDPSTCAMEKNYCLYLTNDGKKYAVGKHLRKGKHQLSKNGVMELDEEYGLNNILLSKAKKQNISINIWKIIQNYHDNVARWNKCIKSEKEYNLNCINKAVNILEESTNFKFPELRFAE